MKKKWKNDVPEIRWGIQKILLIMKLATLFTLVFTVMVSASTYSQTTKLNLSFENSTIEQVLLEIENSSQFIFIYESGTIDRSLKRTISVKEQTIDEVLTELLEGTGVSYKIDDRQVSLYKDKSLVKSDNSGVSSSTQQGKISGKVIDSTGQPLPGVTIIVKGTTTGTITDFDGNYTLAKNLDNAILMFSFVGMQAIEVEVAGKSTINVTMEESSIGLGEVVAIGYGTQRKEDLSAAVTQVSGLSNLQSRPTGNAAEMIKGKVPGVTVLNSDGGNPASSPSVVIRGMGSVGSENVLWVVDGVIGAPFDAQDVISMTVLKDAASAAIYGAHSGSAGVIIVETKKPEAGKVRVTYKSTVGVKEAWRIPHSLTGAEEASVNQLAYTNSGLSVPDGWQEQYNPYVFTTRTNWTEEIFRSAVFQKHSLTLTGGSENVTNLFSASYLDDKGTLLNTFNKNVLLRYEVNFKINDFIKLRQQVKWNLINTRGTNTNNALTGTIAAAMYMPSSAEVYYEDGSFGGVGPLDSDYLGIHGDVRNPVALLLRQQSFDRTQRIYTTTHLEITPFKDLKINNRFTYSQSNRFNKDFAPARPEPGSPRSQNSLYYSADLNHGMQFESVVNYTKRIKKHNITAMAAVYAEENGGKYFSAKAQSFPDEVDWKQFFVYATDYSPQPSDGEWKDRNASFVGRISYNWANRYYLTASLRRDIAGRLAKDYKSKDYPGVTAAWKISSEPWFDVKNVDFLKIRASWGRIGNLSSISRYYGYRTLSTHSTYQLGEVSSLNSGFYEASQWNPLLSWETSEQVDIGGDISLFKERLNVTVDYFEKKTYDLIQRQTAGWPNTMGTGAPLINQGEIRNSGFEFAATWADKKGDFNYSISANFATLNSTVHSIAGGEDDFWQHSNNVRDALVPYRSQVGQPFYSLWLIENDGIFQTDAEATQHTSSNGTVIQPNAKAGDLKFLDQDDDGLINDNDRVFKGSAFPDISYGFGINLDYKRIDFSVFFQGVAGVSLFNGVKFTTHNAEYLHYNRSDQILDAWSTSNTGSGIPKIQRNDPNRNFSTNSDWYVESGDYLRVKNLQIGYTFPIRKTDSNLRIYFSGDNLLTFTKYSGMDPEVGGVGLDLGRYPVSRVLSLGVNVQF